MERISCAEFRKEMAEYLDRVKYRGERLVIHRRGREAAALVPLEDLAALEAAHVITPAAPKKRRRAREGPGLGLDDLRQELGL